jgi:phage tail protein X
VEALLDANPQITNVRKIPDGALIHLPSHVGHHGRSPCGDRAVLQENESLDHLAWRCGVRLHALLRANPGIRDVGQVEDGLVVAIPAASQPQRQPPVRWAMTDGDVPRDWRTTAARSEPQDALVPGTDFNATGPLPCARGAGRAMVQCQFGVKREGDGSGSVTVFWPDGGSRVIFFEAGTPTSYDQSEADAGARMTVSKDGDVFKVRIGDQRFEIAEMIISGG